MGLTQVNSERIEETVDLELAIDRALETYQKKVTTLRGYISVCALSEYEMS